MICKIKRIVLVLCLVTAIVSVVFSPVPAFCETLRFVFLADSRGDSLTDPINTPVLNAIISQIKALSPQPAFVVFGGDMSYRGCIDGTYTFQSWKDLFAPLTSAGIPLYTAIGNHELYVHNQQSEAGFFLANQQQYQNVFTENPGNGPPGYERLVYSFASPKGDAFFAVLDPYYLTADNPNPSLCGTIDPTQLAWLETQVAQTKATHKFLFIHTPYYYVTGTNPADPSESSCTPDDTFTNLWAILDNNLFDIYACGHQHLYSRKTIDSSILPNPPTDPPTPPWQNNVVQLLNGTCGAGVDTSTPTVDPTLWHISQTADTYYFSVVDIKDSQVTITSYSGNTGVYNVFDTTMATVLANNHSQSIDITDNTPLSVTAALDPGNLSGQNADWWVAANTPWGFYTLTPSGWSPGTNMLVQYPLLKIGPVEVFNGYLPVGDYTFYLAVDMSPDGILDEPLYYDGVQVHVTLDTTQRNRLIFISDLHMNVNANYSWLVDHADDLAQFLNQVNARDDVAELVILGDLLDDWVSPVKDSSQAFADILAASNNAGIVAALQAVCRNPNIKVTYVVGNHDMLSFEDLNKAIIANAFPGMNIISESPGLGAYTKDDVIWAEHGHRYCLFNAPDTWSRTGSQLPMGYFISRLAASKAASTGQVTTTPDLLNIFIKPPGETGDILDDAAIIAVFNAIALWSGNWPWDKFSMNQLDGYDTDPSVEDVALTYDTIFSDWTTHQNRVSQVEAVLNDLGSLTIAADLIFEMPDSLKDMYPFNPRIILFGHTHQAAFQYNSADVDTLYANTGTWIDSKPMTWVEIQITAGNRGQKLYEVSLWFDGEQTPRQIDTITVTTQSKKPCTTWSCLEHKRLLKR